MIVAFLPYIVCWDATVVLHMGGTSAKVTKKVIHANNAQFWLTAGQKLPKIRAQNSGYQCKDPNTEKSTSAKFGKPMQGS